MSASSGRAVLIEAIEGLFVSRAGGTTGLRHTGGRVPTVGTPAQRRFELVTATWGQDSGIASAGIAQREAVWEVRVTYLSPATTDAEELERLIQNDMDAVCDWLIVPSVWWPHLDAVIPGQPTVEKITGAGGETTGLVAVLPLTVWYR